MNIQDIIKKVFVMIIKLTMESKKLKGKTEK